MAVEDVFKSNAEVLESPAAGAFAITPGSELDFVTRGIYVGGDGDINVVMNDDTDVTFVGLAAGTIYPLQVKEVKSSGTTATDLIGLI